MAHAPSDAPVGPSSHAGLVTMSDALGAGGGMGASSSCPPDIELRRDAKGLALVGDGMTLRGDFSRLAARVRPDRLGRELIVRATRIRGPHGQPWAVDATAGLGEDAFLLAASGFAVTMYERNPLVAALLADALDRAMADPALAETVGRMRLVVADSILELPKLDAAPDIVVLDPMFPSRHKAAASRKKASMLQRLVGPCPDEGELLGAALGACPRRVVVKRPAKGPNLAGVVPSHSIEGTTIRYDCYVPPR